MYAECLVNLGRGAEARAYLLPIRQRVGLPEASLPAVVTMKEVMQEMRIELCFEGQRFFDVRRWKILDQAFKDAYGVDVTNDQTVTPILRYKHEYIMRNCITCLSRKVRSIKIRYWYKTRVINKEI